MSKKSKVIIAMSGGIDSSVAALLLKKQGFDVLGVFMRFWAEKDHLIGAWNRCCSPEAEKRARWVASYLGLPFYVLDFEKEFKKKIVDYFLREYKKGLTPNPCVFCNRDIKFGLLLKKARALGADFVATGHYARKLKAKNEKLKTTIKNPKLIYKLLTAKDKNKDQSYFLWMLNQEQLERVLFPIGDYTKLEVRKLAEKFKLPISTAPESMEVCFIQTTINDFLSRHLKSKPGKIVDPQGKVLGRHQGLWFYTPGQRKGIGLPGGPFWVLAKDLKRNLLIVTQNEKDLFKKELVCKDLNWISEKKPKLPLKIKAKIRYRQKLAPATIYQFKAKTYQLIFEKPQRAITPGQSVVFYRGEELLGGAIIK